MSLTLATFAAIIQAGPALVGLVNNTVIEVEQMLNALPGASKFAAAEAKINVYLQDAVNDAATLTNLQSIVPTLINAAVAMFNASKVFTKAPAATTPAAPAA